MAMVGRGRNLTATKEKGDMKSFKKLLVYCKSYLPVIIVALVFAIGGTICTIIGPEKIKELIDFIQDGLILGIDMDAFVDICITVALIYAIGTILNYGQQFTMATVTQKVSKKLRSDINGKIDRLPFNYFDRTTTRGDILSRVTNAVDIISQTLSQSTARRACIVY